MDFISELVGFAWNQGDGPVDSKVYDYATSKCIAPGKVRIYSVPELVYHRPTGFFGDVATWTEWHTFEPRDCG